VLGCNDPAACNYDPDVNFNVPELCCILPDNCIGLDPDLICSGFVGINEIGASRLWSVYPNPTSSDFQIKWTDEGTRNADLTLCSMSGGKVWSASGVRLEFGDVVGVQPGIRDPGVYVLTIQSAGEVLRFPIVFMP
jgi:hypothetical protein